MTDQSGNDGPPQFGPREPGVAYAERPCAYGVLPRADGCIALVEVTRPEMRYFDLPGGAIDPGEDEPAALVREFGEETGLKTTAGRLIARARQYMRMADGRPVNNISGFYAVAGVGEDPSLKVEDDHALVWIEPTEAIRRLRHDGHAWAVAAWLRQKSS
jgi:8-oxo-dGTP diphosphatase